MLYTNTLVIKFYLLNDLLKAVLEKDKEKAVKESVQLKASLTTLTAKVETLNKNIEVQKQTEKELQVSKTEKLLLNYVNQRMADLLLIY